MISENEQKELRAAYLAGFNAGVEKDAAILPLIGRGLSSLGRLVGGKLWPAAEKAMTAPINWAGKGVDKALGGAGWYQKARPWLKETMHDVPSQMVQFGTLGGSLNALMAEPGHRGEAFGKGFMQGAIGGAGWGMGANLATRGVAKAFPKFDASITAAAARPLTGEGAGTILQRLKALGAKSHRAVVPFSAGMAGGLLADKATGADETPGEETGEQPREFTAPAPKAMSWGGARNQTW